MLDRPKIAVLLPTYNGAKFLQEQFESLLAQDYHNLIVVARDDNSSDASPKLLEDFATRYPAKVHVIEADGNNLGASGSFSFLVNYVLKHKDRLGLDSAYMAFCDQDDIWETSKLSLTMAAMLNAEAEQPGKPVLVHSDLEVVDEMSQPIAASLARFQGLETQRNTFPNMAISNLVTGCTALINEALANRAMPVSEQAIMHDWWLALVASAFGRVVYLDHALVHYRQHSSNTIGAKEFIQPEPARISFWRRVLGRKVNAHLLEVAVQAGAFLRRYQKELPARYRLSLRICAGMAIRIGFVQRIFYRFARRF